MNTTHQANELSRAREEVTKARHAYQAAKSNSARRAAAEELEFWTNKTAFLANVKSS